MLIIGKERKDSALGQYLILKQKKILVYNKQHSGYCNDYYKNINNEHNIDTSPNLKEENELIT